MLKKKVLLPIAAMLLANSAYAQDYYVKHVQFPANATPEQKVEMASRLVPTSQQLAWQKLELTAFLHFGVNTFTGREWGDGSEDPALFNPTDLDCEQWVRSLKNAGIQMAIITAKHHDGFCLWPTATTTHSVKSSPWRGGKGDVVDELSQACKKYGIKFGVYLSPWDRNAPSYGNSPEYNKMFIEQLTELLTNYGQVDEVWFDGAKGEGKHQEYDWEVYMATIRRLQPHAVTAIMGDDVRWVGNERGLGRTTEWSATVLPPGSNPKSDSIKKELGIIPKSADLGSRELIARASEMFWYPSEVDVSIRPGWFYHEDQNAQVKSLAQLTDIYFQSVGYNSVLLLNVPPDRRGLIHAKDSVNLSRLGEYLRSTFSADYILQGTEPWEAGVGDSREFKVLPGASANILMLQEDISRGQRVEAFVVDALINGSWTRIGEGTTIGYKRMLRLDSAIRPERICVTIKSSRGTANISRVGLYMGQNIEAEEEVQQHKLVPTSAWKLVKTKKPAYAAFDGNESTTWVSASLTPITIDMGAPTIIKGFIYTPPTAEQEGTIYKYSMQVSEDGKKWTDVVANGEFSNIKNNPQPFTVLFGRTYDVRYIRLTPHSEIDGRARTAISELSVIAAEKAE